MMLIRAAVVVGMAAAAATGLATPVMAAPSRSSVTEDQCTTNDGRVQRADDGVGTCVGGTDDARLIEDVSTATSDEDSPSSEDGRRFYVDDYGRRYYDEDGRRFYLDEDGNRYYYDRSAADDD